MQSSEQSPAQVQPAFIYFVQGALPDKMDVWRIRSTGGPPERITHHDSLVSHPVFLNARTLLYLASDSDGSGPWIGTRAETSSAGRIPLTTGNGSSPRLGTGYLLYVSSKGATDSLWKLQGDRATELWSAPNARIMGGPAIARDDGRIAFSVRQNGQSRSRQSRPTAAYRLPRSR